MKCSQRKVGTFSYFSFWDHENISSLSRYLFIYHIEFVDKKCKKKSIFLMICQYQLFFFCWNNFKWFCELHWMSKFMKSSVLKKFLRRIIQHWATYAKRAIQWKWQLQQPGKFNKCIAINSTGPCFSCYIIKLCYKCTYSMVTLVQFLSTFCQM